MQPDAPKKETSIWVYLGFGCAALVVFGLTAIAFLSWFAYREGKKLEEAWGDPAARERRAREVLAYDRLPEGYYPLGSFSVPFLMEVALFSDEQPLPGSKPEKGKETGGFKERGFVYVKLRTFARKKQALQDYIDGKSGPPDWLQTNTQMGSRELIRRGTVEVDGHNLLYAANRGDMVQNGQRMEGITTMFLIDCPKDSRTRFGLWFGPDPHRGQPIAEADYTGTNADPAQIHAFASHFRFCAPG